MRELPGKNSYSDLSWKFCYNQFFNSPVYWILPLSVILTLLSAFKHIKQDNLVQPGSWYNLKNKELVTAVYNSKNRDNMNLIWIKMQV